MLGRTPASTAAFSLDAPRAIASQNLTRCSLRPAGGRPRPRLPAEAARSKARFLLPMATPQRRALRQPVESTPSSPGHTPRDPAHSRDTRHRSWSDPSAPPPRALSRRDGRPRPNPPTTAASTTPARDHTTRNSGSSRNLLNLAGQQPLNPTASGGSRSDAPYCCQVPGCRAARVAPVPAAATSPAASASAATALTSTTSNAPTMAPVSIAAMASRRRATTGL